MGEVKPSAETFAKIKVVGVGGGGGNAVNRMVEKGIKGVNFVAINTDVQALHYNKANEKIHIGKSVTRGLGAGMNPDLGREAAEESQNEIRDALKDSDMVFITCGLGGGTGTGAAPVVAEIAKDLGALTVAVVTRPFSFEGGQRGKIGERGFSELADKVDTIITISNDKLLQVIDKETTLLDAFLVADDVLRQGVQGIAEVITMPGIVNADFADVRTVMSNAGSALMGIGEAEGENRCVEAAKAAISSPLLDMSIEGAQGVVFTISGGSNLGMNEVNEAAKIITASADEEATVIFGAVVDDNLKDQVKITVIATGFDNQKKAPKDNPDNAYAPSSFIEEEQKKDSNSFRDNEDFKEDDTWSEKKTEKEEEREEKKEKKLSKIFSSVEEAQSKFVKEDKNDEDKKDDDDELSVPAFIRKKMK
jgi:cell division protein FtsZ